MLRFGIEDQFVPHGSVSQLQEKLGLDAASIADRIAEEYRKLSGKEPGTEDETKTEKKNPNENKPKEKNPKEDKNTEKENAEEESAKEEGSRDS